MASFVFESAPASNMIQGSVKLSRVRQIIPTFVCSSWPEISLFPPAALLNASRDPRVNSLN